ncbi:MAG: hypothetical protein Q7T54_03615, partial [Candidatus Levybacteria bacterium]|nr:hypothetical protein [Candidatus Levybacteria bacterium]
MKKTILMIVVAVVIAGVSGGGVYLWQNNKTGSEKQVLSNQTCPVCTANQADATGYKEFIVGSFGITVTAEVPKGWSIYESPQNVGTDNLQALPTASFGKDDVAFGDMNWSQVDLYFAGDATHDPSARLVQEAKSGNYGTWSVETVGGIKADVVTF